MIQYESTVKFFKTLVKVYKGYQGEIIITVATQIKPLYKTYFNQIQPLLEFFCEMWHGNQAHLFEKQVIYIL